MSMWNYVSNNNPQALIGAVLAVLTIIIAVPFALLVLKEMRTPSTGRQINFGRVAMLCVGLAVCQFALLMSAPSSFIKLRIFLTASIIVAVTFIVGRLLEAVS